MVVLGPGNTHSVAHFVVLVRSSHLDHFGRTPSEEGIHPVVVEEAGAAYHPAIHTFVNSWFEFEAETGPYFQEELQMSSLFASGLAAVLPRIYSKRQHHVDYWMHGHAPLTSSH